MPVAWAHGNTGATDRSNVVGGTSAGIQPADSEAQTETEADDEFSHTRVYRARPYAVYSTIMAVLGNNRYFRWNPLT